MSDASKIEWTDATWNPITGCTKVSPGCDHCYAETLHERFHGKGSFSMVTLHPDRLDKPLRWRKPKRVFVNSMSDLFHNDVPDEFIARVFAAMALAPQHTFQVLTKRHGRMRSLLSSERFDEMFADALYAIEDPRGEEPAEPIGSAPGPLPNVWLGVSVENQHWANIRIPALLDTPAAVRFLSCEPLLGPVSFRWAKWAPLINASHLDGLKDIDWVIVGGESGPGARPMRPEWARELRDQCTEAGVAFHFKQWGEYGPLGWRVTGSSDGQMVRMGKKNAGRELDGRTWDEYPVQAVNA